jgi:two-component system, OmpR family, sensor histidine kinase BaeS
VKKMQSIRKRISIILFLCTIAAVIICALAVNLAVNNTFNKYLSNLQDKRNKSTVEYFQEIYKNDKKWSVASGAEMMHEAYMNNYCLTLQDENKNIVWGMNPNDIKSKTMMMMHVSNSGVYTSKTFEIRVDNKIVGYILIGQYSPVLISQDDINFKNSINQGILLSAILTIIIVTILSLKISKQFSSPIKVVADTSVKLSKGNYEARSNVKSDIKELANLTSSINTLGDKLKDQDILRKRLVSDISHEIRTPLNILQNNLEAMVDGILPVSKERLASLNDEVIRFGKLVSNLDSLKGIEEDMKLNKKVLFLDEIISGVWEDFSNEAKNKNMEIKFLKQPDAKYKFEGDKDKLKQVFINLLSNAIKFSNNGGEINLNLTENKDKIIFTIQDYGIGIKDTDLPYIFERLYRGDKSRKVTEGNGIGLTIAKKILMLHSSEIMVESKEGEGTTFTIYFNKL